MIEDLGLELAAGGTLSVRPPTLSDQKAVRDEIAKDGGPLKGAEDPRSGEVTLRLVYRCAKWPGERPTYEGFLGMIPLKTWNEAQERLADFFGVRSFLERSRATSENSSAPA